MSGDFFDTNVILYLLDTGPKADGAAAVLKIGGVISVQVLNETLVNCRRKARMTWEETDVFLGGIREICSVEAITEETHDLGRVLAERYQLSIYDAMIVASACLAGCERLLSEDMQHGLRIEGMLEIVDPFRDRSPTAVR